MQMYDINLSYTDINENVFINTMKKLKFKIYKTGNYKKIYCEYKNVKFQIIYKEKKVILDMSYTRDDSSLASYLVNQKVLEYDDIYTKEGYFRKTPTIYKIVSNYINDSRSYSALVNRFIDYIFIEYEKNLNKYKPSSTITVELEYKMADKLLSSDKEREKFFKYIKIDDKEKKYFINYLTSSMINASSSESVVGFFRFSSPIYTLTIKSNFYNNGQDSQNIKKENKTKNNSSEKQSDIKLKEDIKTDDSKNIIKENIINYIPKCKDKLKEIRELSQDFEYAIKNGYYKDCDDIESRLNNCVDNKDEVNKIIDEINNLYRNAYNRKYNKSSLSYVMDIEEDDIDLLEHI